MATKQNMTTKQEMVAWAENGLRAARERRRNASTDAEFSAAVRSVRRWRRRLAEAQGEAESGEQHDVHVKARLVRYGLSCKKCGCLRFITEMVLGHCTDCWEEVGR